MKQAGYIFSVLLILQANLFAQTSRSVCNVTINEKPYILSPEKDSLTKEELMKARLLRVPGNKYRIVSFQVTVTRFNDFGFIVFGPNYGAHEHSASFNRLEPGNKVRVECIQVTDKDGKKEVLQNRTFYIIAGPKKIDSDTVR